MRKEVFVLLASLLVFSLMIQPTLGAQQTTTSVTAQLQPDEVMIGVKDTSIMANATLVMKTLPTLGPGIFLMTGITTNNSKIDIVQKFIDEYKKKYPDKKVFQYFFYYKSNNTVYKPHLYNNVDYVVVSPMSKSELMNYTKMLVGRKIFVVENYMVFTAHFKNNQTGQNVTEAIPITYLIQLYKEGKIAGVMFPFYQIEKDGSQALYDKMKADADTLRNAGIPTIGIVQPYINFFTGSVDLSRTLGSIVLSNKMFGMTLYLSWENMPVPLLAYLDPYKFNCNGGHGISIDWSKAGYYLGLIPALIIIVIFAVAITKKKTKSGDKKKKKESDSKAGKDKKDGK